MKEIANEIEIEIQTINKRLLIQSILKNTKETHARYDLESYLYVVYSMVDPKTVS